MFMTNLVTGGTGLIGQRLVRRLLHRGESVRVLARTTPAAAAGNGPTAEVMLGDMRDEASLQRALVGVRRVYHLAAMTKGDWDEGFEVTVRGTERLLRAAEQAGKPKIIHVSSMAVYDFGTMSDGT